MAGKIRIGMVGTAHPHAPGKLAVVKASPDFELAGQLHGELQEPDESRQLVGPYGSSLGGPLQGRFPVQAALGAEPGEFLASGGMAVQSHGHATRSREPSAVYRPSIQPPPSTSSPL